MLPHVIKSFLCFECFCLDPFQWCKKKKKLQLEFEIAVEFNPLANEPGSACPQVDHHCTKANSVKQLHLQRQFVAGATTKQCSLSELATIRQSIPI